MSKSLVSVFYQDFERRRAYTYNEWYNIKKLKNLNYVEEDVKIGIPKNSKDKVKNKELPHFNEYLKYLDSFEEELKQYDEEIDEVMKRSIKIEEERKIEAKEKAKIELWVFIIFWIILILIVTFW
tara:strand:+ start:1168 stop:1542 length:375 start_codon:yes stop_codon:yes gene_type:complete